MVQVVRVSMIFRHPDRAKAVVIVLKIDDLMIMKGEMDLVCLSIATDMDMSIELETDINTGTVTEIETATTYIVRDITTKNPVTTIVVEAESPQAREGVGGMKVRCGVMARNSRLSRSISVVRTSSMGEGEMIGQTRQEEETVVEWEEEAQGKRGLRG
jgi:hypothetical protein